MCGHGHNNNRDLPKQIPVFLPLNPKPPFMVSAYGLRPTACVLPVTYLSKSILLVAVYSPA
jgi:hypothetical protein